MSARPAGLPDYELPPVEEVVLGVQFDTLQGLVVPHFGQIWTEFREEYPLVEEHPPIEPVFETLGQSPPSSPIPKIQVLDKPPMPRLFFLDKERKALFQVQKDRFLFNWRGDGPEYPRFETVLASFVAGFAKFQSVIASAGIGPVVPNQCEVSYVNPIPFPPTRRFEAIFEGFSHLPPVQDLGSPEDGKFILRYAIRDARGEPIGRLTAVAEPAWKYDSTKIVQFTLTARGAPDPANLEGVQEFMKRGRVCIVNGFTTLTTAAMQAEWKRRK